MRTTALAACVASAVLSAQTLPDTPLAFVADGTGSLQKLGRESTVALRAGDLIFSGDRLDATAPITLWHCPARQVWIVEARATIIVSNTGVQAERGAAHVLTSAPFCPVPQVSRSNLENPEFYGSNLTRSRGALTEKDERAALGPAERGALEQELRVIASTPGIDPPIALAGRAAVFVRSGIHREAAKALDQLAAAIPNVDWPRVLIHDQEMRLVRGEKDMPAIGGEGKTFALLAGISQYKNLDKATQLQFAHRDASVFREFLLSARGGSVPEKDIRLLADQAATVSAIRNGIASFLRAEAGKNDTVILFLAAHGIVDSTGAWVVGYDSDPANLKDTGLPMSEIQQLLESEFSNVGRILLFIDVCRAGSIGNLKNGNFARVLQILGRLEGSETFWTLGERAT